MSASKLIQHIRSEGLAIASSRAAGCNLCNADVAKIWVLTPDTFGDMYLYPLPGAMYCPECGRELENGTHRGRE